jgi:PPK2 family polyphosphate:nucleotide phosphotransferase
VKIEPDKYKVAPHEEINLSKVKTTSGFKTPEKSELRELLLNDTGELSKLQYKLYAENRQALLIVLQGIDGSGKDGTIKHIMSGVNPQGVEVHSFKHPSDEELDHDFLWRHAATLPGRGQITIFNRSHYENVLISRVHPQLVLAERIPGFDSVEKIDEKFWTMRYRQIKRFEKNITQNGTQIVKFYLHLSKEEQRNRFLARIDDKEKHWKFSSADITERGFWNEYEKAYEETLANTSTKIAPWYIIPADDKWYAHLLIGKIIIEKLKLMDPCFPVISKEEEKLLQQAKVKLEKEAL